MAAKPSRFDWNRNPKLSYCNPLVRVPMMKRALIIILLLGLALIPSVHAPIQNPILSNGDTQSYIAYLNTLKNTVTQTHISTSLWTGYRAFPILDTTGGDYYNYWADDQGKILFAANELQDLTLRSTASDFIMRNHLDVPQGSFLVGRHVDSRLYRSVPTGSILDVNYYATNFMIAVVNGSALEGTRVYERAVTLGPVWANKTGSTQTPLDINSPFTVDIAPTEVWFGNDTSHLRRVGIGGSSPSTTLALTLIENIPTQGIAAERANYTIRRVVTLIDPLGLISGVTLTVDTTITLWRPYATISMYVTNGSGGNIVVSNMTLAFASNDHYIPYVPYFYWQKLADGSVTSPNPVLLYRGVNVTLWSSGSQPVSTLFTGFQTPEFADKGYEVSMLNTQLSKIRYTYDFGHSLQYTVNAENQIVADSASSSSAIFLATPMDKTDWSSAPAILNQNDLVIPDGWTLAMPGSWGLILLALAQYGQLTHDQQILTRAKALWNFYKNDVDYRLAPTWIPENPSHAPVLYFRSAYTFALAGLILDSSNSTYLTEAENMAQVTVLQKLDVNPASANYGGLPYALEENGWAYALLLKLYFVTGQRSYQTAAHGILSAIKTNQGFTADTKTSWPNTVSSCTQFLPSVYVANTDGSCSSAFSNHPQNVFRASEMTYGFILGSTFEGTGSLFLYNNTAVLSAVSNIWKMSYSQSVGIAIDARYASDLTGQSNTETQPVGMLGLAIWKQLTFNHTVGVYVEKVTGATLTGLTYNTNGGNMTITLQGPSSGGSATVKVYSRDVQPTVAFITGSGTPSWSAPFLTVTVTLTGSGAGKFIIINPNNPVGPNLPLIIGAVGAVSAVVVGVIYVTRKKVQSQ